MNDIFHPYMDEFFLILIYDILIYSRNLEEHKKLLQIVLETLRENQLYTKFSKCEFFKEEIQYWGHVISCESLSADPEKIRTIMNSYVPKNIVDIRYFMGLVGYYHRFI